MIGTPLRQIAARTAAASEHPERAERFERNLGALAGRLLAPGGWAAGARHADAEVLWTGRARAYDESTVRKAAREMSALGAVAYAEQQLDHQVRGAVRNADVTAFSDMFDQVYWTKKSAWAGPIGSLANRCLASVYFGMTFVQTADGPPLAYHLSWHKPASPLLDALQALHDEPRRHRWLNGHVQVHILDRGTQGDPTLRWALSQGIPYLTLSNGTAHWRRFDHPTLRTDKDVPLFVRHDMRLADADVAQGRASSPRLIVFPANPDAGPDDGRALRYRTAAALSNEQIATLDQVYKGRWPGNENPIKALVAVGFDRNLDRTLELTTSRGHDGDRRRQRERIASLDTRIDALRSQPFQQAGRAYVRLAAQRANKVTKLAQFEAKAQTRGTRCDRGGEHLCKLLTLLLFNALALLLWRSPLEAVRTMTPALVRQLLLSRSAVVRCEHGKLCLAVAALRDPTDYAYQHELVRLFNNARLRAGDKRLSLRLRDPPAILQQLRIAA